MTKSNINHNSAIEQIAREAFDSTTKLLLANLPQIRHLLSTLLELLFIPRTIARQILLVFLLESSFLSLTLLSSLTHSLTTNFSSRARLLRQLTLQQSKSTTQDDWMELAEQMDAIQGNDVWRSDPQCALYEADRIGARIDEFVHLMRRCDGFDLMFTLRGGIARNRFGLLHSGLFSRALAGSKVLIETYHNVVCASLDFVCDAPVTNDTPIPTDARLAFFNETRHAYGRSALLMSGGAALGFYHVGVAKALMENGLLPRVLSGASAGSIVCAMIGTRTDEEVLRDMVKAKGTNSPGHSGVLKLDFFRPLGYFKKNEHLKHSHSSGDILNNPLSEVLTNSAGAFHDIKRTYQGLMPIGIRQFTSTVYDILTLHKRPQDLLLSDTDHFRSCCRASIGDFTFQEAFDRTGRILNITVSPAANRSDPPRLLNYLTAPHVLVWSAAVASSSLPGVFESNKLLVRDSDGTQRTESGYSSRNNQSFQDGSMEADLPMQQLSEMFNINHFIISQANPHAVLFAGNSWSGGGHTIWNHPIIGACDGLLKFVKQQLKSWLRNLVELVGGRRVAPLWETRRGFLTQFFTQEYVGRDFDITINPWRGRFSLANAFWHCIYNPTDGDFVDWIGSAERETWKYIPAIKSHCAVEMTLDRCVQRLRKRLVAESWELKMQHTSGMFHQDGSPNNNFPKSPQQQLTKRQQSLDKKMEKRVPSFFTSPSLVNFGGLGVSDPSTLHTKPNSSKSGTNVTEGGTDSEGPHQPFNFQLQSGWGGMGLRGNHSSGNLNRTFSGGSGLFLIDASDDEEDSTAVTKTTSFATTNSSLSSNHLKPQNSAYTHSKDLMKVLQKENAHAQPTVYDGSTTVAMPRMRKYSNAEDNEPIVTDANAPNNPHATGAFTTTKANDGGYTKSTNMTQFYYRKRNSNENLTGPAARRKETM
mmetsp:Transcript_63041/g.73749  ORF Transcript_63041/g.73749 Transcript_63041/m.73749 type:complete len:928 (+) Transcript_63041:948-3731(+)|eukprot:CAMPEP_0194408316 /NCGR_PEP_ID=MMETSP0176-20130528/6236_1 /TAXON_ID=216777 /ORGANISM="Proboscia alata, Strain PI-D3" /LENGTH=927 /DNA_ID=CAMNT_0039208375 /DNA_START=883 /DNA_END=3666 /DNA_ORIENTATION=-